MSNLTPDTTESRPRRRHVRRHILLPDGEVLEPREEFANIRLGVSDKTAKRLNLPTTYIANVAYVARNASLKLVAARIQRRNQPRHRGAR
jgi:hypothetical protein